MINKLIPITILLLNIVIIETVNSAPIVNAAETISQNKMITGFNQTLGHGANVLEFIDRSQKVVSGLDRKIEKADALYKKHKQLFNLIYGKKKSPIGKVAQEYNKMIRAKEILTKTKSSLQYNQLKMNGVISNLSKGVQNVAKYTGRVMNAVTVVNSVNTLSSEESNLLEKANAVADVGKVVIKKASSVIFDVTMAGVELGLNSARENATILINVMQSDVNNFHNEKRKIIIDAVVENPDLSSVEIESIAKVKLGELARTYFKRYQHQGTMYNKIHGGLAKGLAHLATGKADINTYDANLKTFSEYMNSDANVAEIISNRVVAVRSQVNELIEVEQQASAAFLGVSSDTVKLKNVMSQTSESVGDFVSSTSELSSLESDFYVQHDNRQEQVTDKKEQHKRDRDALKRKRQSAQSKLNSNKSNSKNTQKSIENSRKTLSSLYGNRNSKQSELNRLLNKKGSSASTKNEEARLSDVRKRIGWIRRVNDIKRKYKNSSANRVSRFDRDTLINIAGLLGYGNNLKKLLAISGSLYTNARIEESGLVKRIETIKNSGGQLSYSDQKRIDSLKKQLSSLGRKIKSANSRVNSLDNNLDLYAAEYKTLFNDVVSIDEDIVGLDETYTANVNNDFSITPDTATPETKLVWAGFIGIVGSGSGTYRYSSSATPSYNGETQTPLVSGGNSLPVTFSNLDQDITVTPDFGSYSYVAWGTWDGGTAITYTADSDGKTFNPVDGHWVYGQAIGPDDIPKTGSASYAGSVMGGYVNHGNGTVETNSITGTINMNVVFSNSNNSLSGTMNLKRNNAAWVNTSFSSGAARPSATGGSYRSELTVENGGKGNIRGAFFGPGAEEMAGSYNVDKQSGDFGGSSGVFRAKKQ